MHQQLLVVDKKNIRLLLHLVESVTLIANGQPPYRYRIFDMNVFM